MTHPLQEIDHRLPDGTVLRCLQTDAAATGASAEAPRVMLLHGFPEAAFVWTDTLQALAGEAQLIAPNLRGYGGSSAPTEVSAYRARHLVGDLVALIDTWAGEGRPLDLLVAHDWGGAVAWNLAAARPERLRRLLILNSPHPATFLQALRTDPAQQQASAYMHRLCEADAAPQLAADDFAAMWRLFDQFGSGPPAWLDAPARERYRAVWQRGLQPMLDWYRASPLKPPLGPDDPVMTLELPASVTEVRVPTRVLWGEADTALPPGLLDGLEQHVSPLSIRRVPGASHWLLHEQPALVIEEIRAALSG